VSIPHVSIIIPAYNVTSCIGEALESVFGQTYRDFEVIVVNDGCPDTAALEGVLERYRAGIVYLKQKNRGPAGARNTGIQAARGELVALLDADDLWLPQFLEQQVRVLDQRPELDLLWCDSVLFGESVWANHRFFELFPPHRPVTLEGIITGRCVPVTSCVLVRRAALLNAGLFDEEFRRAEDFDLWIRLARAGVKADFQKAALGRRRVRGDSLSADSTAPFEAAIAVLEKLRKALPGADAVTSVVVKELRRNRAFLAHARARDHMERREYGLALSWYRAANRENWSPIRALVVVLLNIWPGLADVVRRRHQDLVRRRRQRPTPVGGAAG